MTTSLGNELLLDAVKSGDAGAVKQLLLANADSKQAKAARLWCEVGEIFPKQK